MRWRDATGLRDGASLFADGFRTSFSYADVARSYAAVNLTDGGAKLTGVLQAMRLKPNTAYQLKLEAKAPITNASAPPAATVDPKGWASWQLGHAGRWWCSTCSWNVSDADLASHVSAGHHVTGYLLFGFFVTGKNGCARHAFTLDSSYHVLWRTDQRKRATNDSKVAYYVANRGAWGYGLATDQPGPCVALYAEWEPGRPGPGKLTLPPGGYPVQLRLTEETFHESGDFCGSWPAVLGRDIRFVVGKAGVRVATMPGS